VWFGKLCFFTPLFLTFFSQAQMETFTSDILTYDTRLPFADFNNDGREDLITSCGNDQAAVALSTSDGSYGPPTCCYPLPNGQVRDTAVGDFNSDGNLDLMISNAFSTVYEFLNDGKGNFRLARSIAVAGSAHSLATADVNHDGIIDLLYFEDVSQCSMFCSASLTVPSSWDQPLSFIRQLRETSYMSATSTAMARPTSSGRGRFSRPMCKWDMATGRAISS
jgi:hypothetical protein